MIKYKIKEDSINTWVYKWVVSNDALTDKMCDFTWSVILGWLMIAFTFPVLLPTLCFKRYRDNPTKLYPAVLLVVELILGFLLFVGYSLFHIEWSWDGFLHTLLFFAVLIIILAVFFGTLFGIVWSIRKAYRAIKDYRMDSMTSEQRIAYWKKQTEKEINKSQPSFIVVAIESFLDKHCPKIEWVKK